VTVLMLIDMQRIWIILHSKQNRFKFRPLTSTLTGKSILQSFAIEIGLTNEISFVFHFEFNSFLRREHQQVLVSALEEVQRSVGVLFVVCCCSMQRRSLMID
jgi:hypothetical protein